MPPDRPDELFDVLTSDGVPTGKRKPRGLVHRDGDWHRAFHLWIACRDEHGARILFQRRAPGKDTWPGRLDVAVGGHFRAGETLIEVVREVDEELGFLPALGDLIPLGRRRTESVTPGWVDRELQDVFLLIVGPDVPPLRPDRDELAALYLVPVDGLIALITGHGSAPAERARITPDGLLGMWTSAVVTLDDFIPGRDDYLLRAAQAVRQAVAGEIPRLG